MILADIESPLNKDLFLESATVIYFGFFVHNGGEGGGRRDERRGCKEKKKGQTGQGQSIAISRRNIHPQQSTERL